MSYQIKSTPYFRRMFNNSKKNGQLQRLREEYERIQEFNDRTIELKMRQVRLKRLFREIEEIKEGGGPVAGVSNSANTATRASGGTAPSPTSASHSVRRRQHHHHHPHQRFAGITPEQRRFHQRAEALIRSRELGKQLSRRNAEMTEAGVGGFMRADLRATAKMQAVADARRDALDRRERAAKRISYGNDQSRQNLQRQVKVVQRRLTAQHQPEIRQQNPLCPDYRNLTPSQLDLLVDEEELAAEQQRYFREQEEDELQLAEDRFRRQEERRRLEAEYSEEGQEDQEELRFLRGEQALSAAEEEGNDDNAKGRWQQHQVKHQQQERFFRSQTDELELAEERFRRQEERLRLEADFSDEGQEDPEEGHRRLKQVDEKEAEQQRRRLHMREKTSLLPLGRFSLSSTTTENPLCHVDPAQNARSHQHYRNRHSQCQQVTLSSDQEMRTAPLAAEEHMTPLVATRSTTLSGHPAQQPMPRNSLGGKNIDSEADPLPALNNWHRVSLMMPWFKAFPARKSACPVPRSFAGPTDEQLRGGETPEPSRMNQPHQQ